MATHFQNVGLNAIERAETVGRQLAIGIIQSAMRILYCKESVD